METSDARIDLTSPAFQEGQSIPDTHTRDADDASPPLQWTKPPEGTASLALICDDPDAPRGTWVHWVLFNLPPDLSSLEEGIPARGSLANGARQGRNDFGGVGFGGPSPPPGPAHRYFFKLYALDTMLGLPAGATKIQLEQEMKGHILARGQLIGKYGRSRQ